MKRAGRQWWRGVDVVVTGRICDEMGSSGAMAKERQVLVLFCINMKCVYCVSEGKELVVGVVVEED